MKYSRISASLTHRAARAFGAKRLAVAPERPVVSISFDDFPTSAWDIGGRILAHHGVRGSYYLSGNLCGTEFDGNRIIDADRLKEVVSAGHEIGCHTFNHQRLRSISAKHIKNEFEANQAFLNTVLPGEKLTTFAYPYGDVSPFSKQVASSHFAASRGVFTGVNAGRADLGLLSCVSLEPHVLAKRSATEWINEAVRSNGWLVFLAHDVSETPGYFGVTPDFLDDVIRTAIEAGCDILPVRDALDLLSHKHVGV
jgi:peptidoglycan/xylan/chitin deacetylase (PgdA/CDA1 family)